MSQGSLLQEINRLSQRARSILAQDGFFEVINHLGEKVSVLLKYPYYLRQAGKRKFTIGQTSIAYFYHPYNKTWFNERAVEIGLAKYFLEKTKPISSILEIGNVLNYYISFPHDVVDKYEKSPGVKNVDLIDFKPQIPYEALVSISTFEHIGWDETPKVPEKIISAFKALENLINPKTKVFFTVPVGYNSALDHYLQNQALPFDQCFYLVRLDKKNNWQQTSPDQAFRCQHGNPFPNANALFVGLKNFKF